MSDALVLTSAVHSEAGNPNREIRMGAIIAAAFFVVFLGWAALVPLDAGVHAGGTGRRCSTRTVAWSTRSTFARGSTCAPATC